MRKHVLALAASTAIMVTCSVFDATAQPVGGQGPAARDQVQGEPLARDQQHLIPPSMIGTMAPGVTRMMFLMMDADGDGTVTVAEFQAAHERIFKAIDTNKDGRLTIEELQAFVQAHGGSASGPIARSTHWSRGCQAMLDGLLAAEATGNGGLAAFLDGGLRGAGCW